MASPGWSKENVAVVSGANRGIGFEIVRSLAEQDLTVVLTARDETKGKAAVDELQGKGLKTVVFHQLDPTDVKSVESLATWLKTEYGGVDILVNNAGMDTTAFTYDAAKTVMDINYYGTKKLCAGLLPILRPSPNGARIVMISSRSGFYERLQSESLLNIFRDEDNYSEEVADSLVERYLADLKAERTEAEGWIRNEVSLMPVYSESKMFLNVYSSALAKSFAKTQTEGNEIFIAGLCPGVTLTDMLKTGMKKGFKPAQGYPIKSPAEGAETAVWLALLPRSEWEGKSGKLFAENTEYPFGLKDLPVYI